MKPSPKAENIFKQISGENTKLSDLRTIAKQTKKDHQLAIELWSTEQFMARQLAILIMDNKLLEEKLVDSLINDIVQHNNLEKLQLIDWLMANQLSKNKNTVTLMESWENSKIPLKRRLFWYYKARLRWMAKPQPDSENLLTIIEKNIEREKPEVQWAMNFTVAWIGVFEKVLRNRCIALGEKTELFKGQMVSKGCTPDYLPDFIKIESDKRNL